MAERVELYIYRKNELADGRIPQAWTDPEGLTKTPAHHRVLWLTNPSSWGDDDPVRAYVLVDDRVAGYVALVAGEVLYRGEPVRVLWGFDLIVSTAFRGKGLAIKLIQAWRDAHHTTMGTNVNDISAGIYHKLDWREIVQPCYTTIGRSRPFVAGFLPGPAAAIAAPLVDLGLAARRTIGGVGHRTPSGLSVERVQAMPLDLDPILDRQGATVVTHRSAAWFDWQFRAGRAAAGIELGLFLVRGAKGSVAGYFLIQLRRWATLRERFKDVLVGSARDWRILDENELDPATLSVLATREAMRMGADAAHISIPDRTAGRALEKRGYRSVQPLRTMYHAHPTSPLAGEDLSDPHSWRTTAAEADGLVI